MLDFHTILFRSAVWDSRIPCLISWRSDVCSLLTVSHLSGVIPCNTRSRRVAQAINLRRFYELLNILLLAEMANLFTMKQTFHAGKSGVSLPRCSRGPNETSVAARFCTGSLVCGHR
jgi:hypothetical protein